MLYNTLSRMGKQVVLLSYGGEGHGLNKPDNQKDYYMRQKQWFDHYLKDKPAATWMVKGEHQ